MGHFSDSPLCGTHNFLQGSSGLLLPTMATVLGGRPMTPPAPKCWGLPLRLSCTCTNGFPWALLMLPISNSPHDPYPLLNCTFPQWPLRASHRAKPQLLRLPWYNLLKKAEAGGSEVLGQPEIHPSMPSNLASPMRLIHDRVQMPARGPTLATSGTKLVFAETEETLPRFHLNST